MVVTSDQTGPDRPLRVFLCHSSGDKPVVRELCHRLRADGFAPWLDEEELLPGQDWQEEIPAALRACDVVVVCLSHKSVTKEGYLQREIKEALYAAEEKLEGTIFIVPVRLEEVEVPRRLGRWQWADLFREGGYQRLVRALNVRASAIGVTVSSGATYVGAVFPGPPSSIRRPEEARRGAEAESKAEKKRTEWLCMGCMADKGSSPTCLNCGWEEGRSAESPVQLPPRTILDGRYLVGRALGQGGFGITYLAWDLNLNCKLAVKEYFPRDLCTRGRDERTVQPLTGRTQEPYEYGLRKFLEEGQALARFRDHPGIASVLGFFQEHGTAYLVMAYLEGLTFKQYLEEHDGKIPFQAALNILTPVMDALREVHGLGMLHRDVSPDNIYLTKNRQVKILDFGAARYAMGEVSQDLSVVLKPGYAPEEQHRRRGRQGPWTDVYALGATFYRAITGRVPSDAPDRLAHDDLIPPRHLRVDIPAKSEAALLKALAVHAEDRFQSIAEFQSAVSAAALTEEVDVGRTAEEGPSELARAAAEAEPKAREEEEAGRLRAEAGRKAGEQAEAQERARAEQLRPEKEEKRRAQQQAERDAREKAEAATKTAHPHQPLSAQAYAIIALAGLVVGISLLFFYVYQVPKLVKSGAQNQVFYLLLVPWALSCAAFLFGTMRSYAHLTHRHVGSALELGGPVVLFCLVVAGGFKLVPAPAEAWSLTVRAHSADGRDTIITSGKVIIDLDNDRRAGGFNSNGEADFKGVPARFKGATIRVLVQVDGYKSEWQSHKLAGDVLDLALVREPKSVTHLSGSILPPPKDWEDLRVVVDGQQVKGWLDEIGRFDFAVNGKDGERVPVRIYAGAELVYNGYQTLPGPVTLKLSRATPKLVGGGKPALDSRPVPDAKQVQQAITMGNFHFEKGEYDEAIRWYRNGLSLDPANGELKRLLERARSAKASEAQ